MSASAFPRKHDFDTSLATPTDIRNHPATVYMLPCVYVGKEALPPSPPEFTYPDPTNLLYNGKMVIGEFHTSEDTHVGAGNNPDYGYFIENAIISKMFTSTSNTWTYLYVNKVLSNKLFIYIDDEPPVQIDRWQSELRYINKSVSLFKEVGKEFYLRVGY